MAENSLREDAPLSDPIEEEAVEALELGIRCVQTGIRPKCQQSCCAVTPRISEMSKMHNGISMMLLYFWDGQYEYHLLKSYSAMHVLTGIQQDKAEKFQEDLGITGITEDDARKAFQLIKAFSKSLEDEEGGALGAPQGEKEAQDNELQDFLSNRLQVVDKLYELEQLHPNDYTIIDVLRQKQSLLQWYSEKGREMLMLYFENAGMANLPIHLVHTSNILAVHEQQCIKELEKKLQEHVCDFDSLLSRSICLMVSAHSPPDTPWLVREDIMSALVERLLKLTLSPLLMSALDICIDENWSESGFKWALNRVLQQALHYVFRYHKLHYHPSHKYSERQLYKNSEESRSALWLFAAHVKTVHEEDMILSYEELPTAEVNTLPQMVTGILRAHGKIYCPSRHSLLFEVMWALSQVLVMKLGKHALKFLVLPDSMQLVENAPEAVATSIIELFHHVDVACEPDMMKEIVLIMFSRIFSCGYLW